MNMYGPTETTVWSTRYEITDGEQTNKIGVPIANTRIYILDKQLQLMPLGSIGELYIGGYGLARGYLNQPELTAERFISSPFDAEDRLYKTGDLARWLPDGNIEYLGRMDQQVKIRGYRIEMGEVEVQLLKIKGVQDVVVLARANEEGRTNFTLIW